MTPQNALQKVRHYISEFSKGKQRSLTFIKKNV
jgi:hypothetical protein